MNGTWEWGIVEKEVDGDRERGEGEAPFALIFYLVADNQHSHGVLRLLSAQTYRSGRHDAKWRVRGDRPHIITVTSR